MYAQYCLTEVQTPRQCSCITNIVEVPAVSKDHREIATKVWTQIFLRIARGMRTHVKCPYIGGTWRVVRVHNASHAGRCLKKAYRRYRVGNDFLLITIRQKIFSSSYTIGIFSMQYHIQHTQDLKCIPTLWTAE